MKYEVTTSKMKVEFMTKDSAFSYAKDLILHNKWVMVRKVLKNSKKFKTDLNISFSDILNSEDKT